MPLAMTSEPGVKGAVARIQINLGVFEAGSSNQYVRQAVVINVSGCDAGCRAVKAGIYRDDGLRNVVVAKQGGKVLDAWTWTRGAFAVTMTATMASFPS